jgi:hypothetical protein
MGTRMAAFRIELLHHADDAWEPLLAERHEIHSPDLEAIVVQARALFGALSPGRPSLVSFRIMEDGLIVLRPVLRAAVAREKDDLRKSRFAMDSPLEGDGFEPSVPL